MRQFLTGILGVMLAWAPASLAGVEFYVVNSASRTLSRIDLETGAINNTFAQLGLTPNLMDLDADHIYVACSGDNAVQVLNRDDGSLVRYIPVAASCNPWDVLKAGEFLYVSGLFTNRVYKISLTSGAVVGSLEVGTAPEGLAAGGNRLYVCNTGGYSSGYANSSVTVIDLALFSVVTTIPVWTNPQYAVVRGSHMHVSCTGNWTDITGKVDIIDLNSLTLAQRLDIGGRPGSLWISPGGTAYVGESMGTGLYSYDADSFELQHTAANPLNYSAFAIAGSSDRIALLEQNWSGYSVVRAYDHSFTPLETYTVGLSSTDIAMWVSETASPSETQAAPALRLYPNPLPRNGSLRFNSAAPDPVRFQLYNLRGQRLKTFSGLRNGELITLPGLKPGLYLYRIVQGQQTQTGKLLILEA